MKFELCIFDLDGTLVDTSADLASAVNDVLRRSGLGQKSVQEVIGYVGDGLLPLMKRCIGNHEVDVEEAVDMFKEAYTRRILETTHLYSGVREMLETINPARKAVLTNKPYGFTLKIMDYLELSPDFMLVVGGDTLQTRKPSTEGIEHILEKTGTDRSRAVMIGDSRNDVLTARDAGVASVFVTWGFSTVQRLHGIEPDFTVNSPGQISALVL